MRGAIGPQAGPTDSRPPFRFSALMRVGFDETDAQGVVYYGRYLPYFDRARVEYLRHLGLLGGLPSGQEFVMRRSVQEYEAPARFDDALEVFIRTSHIGRSSMAIAYRAEAAGDGMLLTSAEQVVVLIDAALRRPVAISDEVRNRVMAFEEPSA